MNDDKVNEREQYAELGRRMVRDAAARTEPGRLAAQIGQLLYDGLGVFCQCGRRRESDEYQKQVKMLTEVQGHLEKVALAEAKVSLGLR